MQTFLFTDVEGSTRLWERHPEAMRVAIARQERILRDTIELRAGSVFNTAGDSVCAVFPSSGQAVAAAIAAQRALHDEPWELLAPDLRVAVRMAVDTGEALASGENYLGPVLNQLHRLMKTGHGGQILCGSAIAETGSVGPDIELRYLGSHTLRDISDEMRIFQIVAPGLPERFPRLIVERPPSTRLPWRPATLFGRDADLTRIGAILRERSARVVTLLGPGGVGKTTLALSLAGELDDAFPDGVHFVDLSALRDSQLVVPAIASTLQIEDPLLSPEDAVLSGLRSRELLLVLDNCEQVIDEVARFVGRVAAQTELVSVLCTSRTPMRIAPEREQHIEPLPLPEEGSDLTQNPAMQLFGEHARQVNERFALNAATQTAVMDICRMVDGLPLAIELAAAWVRILDPATLRNRLAKGAPLLRSDARDRPDRHRTLTSTIDWSYQLLPPNAQSAFGRLAVFQGGIPFDGALAVLQADNRATFLEALEQLDLLVQANLVQLPTETADGPRYGMLQTIQEFGLGALSPDEQAATAHARYFAAMATSAEEHYRDSEAAVWLARLDANLENLRAASAWLASSESDQPDDALQMAIDLWEYFDLRNRHPEARELLTSVLEVSSPRPSMAHARALTLLGHTLLGHSEQAETYYRRSIEMVGELSNAASPFDALAGLVVLAQMRGDLTTAISWANDALRHARESHRPELTAHALLLLGQLLAEANHPEAAIGCWAESRGISEQLGDSVGLAWIRRAEGELYFWQGDYPAAEDSMLRVIDALEPVGERRLIALCQLDVAKIAALRGDRARALTFLKSAVDELAIGGIVISIWEAVRTGAIVLTLVLDQPATALTLFAAAESWSSSTGNWVSSQRGALAKEIQHVATMRSPGSPRSVVATPLSPRAAIEFLQQTIGGSAGVPKPVRTRVTER